MIAKLEFLFLSMQGAVHVAPVLHPYLSFKYILLCLYFIVCPYLLTHRISLDILHTKLPGMPLVLLVQFVHIPTSTGTIGTIACLMPHGTIHQMLMISRDLMLLGLCFGKNSSDGILSLLYARRQPTCNVCKVEYAIFEVRLLILAFQVYRQEIFWGNMMRMLLKLAWDLVPAKNVVCSHGNGVQGCLLLKYMALTIYVHLAHISR